MAQKGVPCDIPSSGFGGGVLRGSSSGKSKDEHVASKDQQTAGKKKQDEDTTTQSPKLLRQTSKDRLRRRMDVPFDPYDKDITIVPETLGGVTFVCEAGVFQRTLSLSLITCRPLEASAYCRLGGGSVSSSKCS